MSKNPVKSPAAMDMSKSPAKLFGSVDLTKSPQMKSEPHANIFSKSPVDLSKCPQAVSETVKNPIKSVSGESLPTSGLFSGTSKLSMSTNVIPPVLVTTTSPVKTTTPSAIPTSSVKPVFSTNILPQKEAFPSEKQTKSLMAGSRSPNTNTPVSSISGMSAHSPTTSVASTNSPVSQPVGSPPLKSFVIQTTAAISPVIQGSSAKSTATHSLVSSPKPPLTQSRSPVISGMGMSPSKPSYQPGGTMSPSKSFGTDSLQSSTRISGEATSVTPCTDISASKSGSILPSGRSPILQGSSMLPSKSTTQSEIGPSPIKQSTLQSTSQSSTRQPFVQSTTRSPDTTLSPRPPLVQSTNQSPIHRPVMPSSNHSPTQRSAAPSSNMSLTRQPVVQTSNLLSKQQPLESSANLAPVHSPITGTNLSQVSQPVGQSAHLSPTQQPVVQSANTSQSSTVQGTNLSSVKSSLVPNPYQTPVKSPVTSIGFGKSTTGYTSLSKSVSPLSVGAGQNKPDASSLGHHSPLSQSGSQQSKTVHVPTTGQMTPLKTSVNLTASSPQAKSPVQISSISPTKPAGYPERPTLTSAPSSKSATTVSSTSTTKPTSESGSSQCKLGAVSMSSGSPIKPVVQPPSVPIGQSGTQSHTFKPVLSSVSSKSQQPYIQETKISSSQSAAMSGLKPLVTHTAVGASSKPLVTHMTGVLPQKTSSSHSAVMMPSKTSSLSLNKSPITLGFSTSPPKPSTGQGYSKTQFMPGSPVVSKPSIMPSASNTPPKPQLLHESSGISSKPQQPLASPPKPQVTHMAGVAVHSRPQITHMSGVAPPKSQMGPSDVSSHPKPPVVHVTGSAVPKSSGTVSTSFSHSVAVSPPKTSLHSSTSFHSTTTSSTADVSSFSSQPLSKSPSVPVTSTGTGKPNVLPSLGGVQSISSQKYSLGGASTVSGQHQAQLDSSHGRLLSSISQQTTSSTPTLMSNIQSSQSSHSQKSNVLPTKSPEDKKPANIPGTLNKSMQLSSTAGQPGDTKTQSSTCIVSKTSDSSLSSSTPSAKSLFSKQTLIESQSKVPTLSTSNLQATIPVISSAAPVASSKPDSSGSSHVPTRPISTGQIQSNVEHLQPQSARTSVPPSLATVGNVQQTGAISIPGASPQLADSSKASSSSDGVINGAGAKTLADQSSEANRKRKLESEQTEDSHDAKKARVSSEDTKSLIANGQKDSSNIHQAPKLMTSQSSNKPEVMDVDPSPSMKQDSNGNEVSLKDYVVVNKNDVPHKDSPEVKNSLPKMPLSNPLPQQVNISSGCSSTTSSSSNSSNSSSSNPSGTGESSAQGTGFKDILLNRAFKLNPTLFSSAITEKSKQFSVVTYNILADCHFRRNDKLNRYPADEKPFIELPARHKRLMAELCYVDADIVCLQEVEPEYYSKTLSPDMQR